MRALLDTHSLLWLVDNPDKLPATVTAICEDENNALFISIASFWELAIKMSLGKIELTALVEGGFAMDFRLTHPWFGEVFRYAGQFRTE